MTKPRTWICRYIDQYGIPAEHMATGNMFANKARGVYECEKHTKYYD